MASSDQFTRKTFKLSVTNGTDALELRKEEYSDWVSLEMITNGEPNGFITLRGESIAEGLRFLLEQLLKG